MPSFSENFLRGYQVGNEAKSRREREKIEREQLALHRQQVLTQLQRQEEDDKIREVQRGQQEALALLELAKASPRPQVPMPEGQAGPPQPAQVEPIQFPTFGGKMMPLTPRFQEDVQAQQLAAREAQGQVDLNLAVEKEKALAPLQAAAKLQAESIMLPPAMARQLGLPEGVPTHKEIVNTAEAIFGQRQANARQAMEIGARLKQRGAEERTPENIRHLADQVRKRNLDLAAANLGVATNNAIMFDLAERGLSVPRPLTAKQKDFVSKAQAGLSAVETMKRLYRENPNVLSTAGVPSNLGRLVVGKVTGTPAQAFDFARRQSAEISLREATGAATNASEIALYEKKFAPSFGDAPDVVEMKLGQQEALYAGLAGIPVIITMPDGKEFTVEDAYNPTSRARMRHAIEHGGQVTVDY